MDRHVKAQRWLTSGSLTVVLLLAGCQSASSRFAAAREPSSSMEKERAELAAGSGLPLNRPTKNDDRAFDSQEESQSSEQATPVSMVGFQIDHVAEKPAFETTTVLPASQIKLIDSADTTSQSVDYAAGVDDPLAIAPYMTSELSFSLQDAIATSLTQNPDMIAARGQEEVSTAAVGVAETYIWNPFVQAQIRPGDGRGGDSNYYIWLMQRFELAHQQQFRENSSRSLLNQVRWTIHQTELTNISTTSQFYFTALYQRELHDLANQTAELNNDLLGIVERRFKAGVSTAAQVTTAKVAARQSHNQLNLANANFQTALLALRRQLNLSPSDALTLTDRLPRFYWHPAHEFVGSVSDSESTDSTDPRLMAAELVQGRPDVMAALAGVHAASANAHLANAARTPDLQLGPILDKNANGSYDVGVRVQRDLFVFNNGRPLTRQRNAEWQQQNRVYTQLKTRATREAETAIDRYERARALAKGTKVDLSPFGEKMPDDLKDINAQFQAGQADVLIVYATQNSLLQDRRTYLDSLNELALSTAAVVLATAVPVERIVTLADDQNNP